MKRRIISLVLTASMVIGNIAVFPVAALEDGGDEWEEEYGDEFYGQIIELDNIYSFDIPKNASYEPGLRIVPDETGRYGFILSNDYPEWNSIEPVFVINVDTGDYSRVIEEVNSVDNEGEVIVWYWLESGATYNIYFGFFGCDGNPAAAFDMMVIKGSDTRLDQRYFVVNGKEQPLNSADYSAYAGEEVDLEVVVDGAAPGAVGYQWYKRTIDPDTGSFNVTELEGETSAILTMTVEDSARYICKLTGSDDPYDYAFCDCMITIRPEWSAFGASARDDYFGRYYFDYGSTGTVTVMTRFTGEEAPTLYYSWYDEDGVLVPDSTGTVTAGESFDFTVPEVTCSTNYECRICDETGNYQTGTARVQCNYGAVAQPSSVIVLSDEMTKYTLHVDVPDYDGKLNYRWMYNGLCFETTSDPSTVITEELSNSYFDLLERNGYTDINGKNAIQCEVSSDDGEVYELVNYFFCKAGSEGLLYAYSMNREYTNISYGDVARLEVGIIGDDSNATYTWKTYDNVIEGASGRYLDLNYSQVLEYGTWITCQVTDGIKSFDVRFLIIMQQPIGINGTDGETIYVREGDSVVLDSNVWLAPGVSEDDVTYEWSFTPDSGNSYYTFEGADGKTFTTPQLVKPGNDAEYYEYQVVARNSHGDAYKYFYVYVIGEEDSGAKLKVGEGPYGDYVRSFAGADFWNMVILTGITHGSWTLSCYNESGESVMEPVTYYWDDVADICFDGIDSTQTYTFKAELSSGKVITAEMHVLVEDPTKDNYPCEEKTIVDGNDYGGFWYDYREGSTVVFSAPARNGARLTDISVKKNDGTEIEYTYIGGDRYSFVMPASGVCVSVNYTTVSGDGPFIATADVSGNGTVTLSSDSAMAGGIITVNAKPKAGYKLDKIVVLGMNGEGVEVGPDNTFAMPACDVTVKAFFIESGEPVLTGWQKIDGKWFYYDESGEKVTGWTKLEEFYYYLDPLADGAMATGWLEVDGKWYFFNAAGAMRKGWLNRGGNWYYFDGSGAMATGWKKVDGKWYYFDLVSGAMAKGWKKISNDWYYFVDSGAMSVGWKLIDGKYYYFDSNGHMQTGWLKDKNKWYYLDSSGIMLTGWKYIAKKWYFFNDSGVMQTGWYEEDDYSYYFDPDSGAMVTNCTVEIEGENYTFDRDGHLCMEVQY